MYQLYKSVADGLSKQAQETTVIKVNNVDYNFLYFNRVVTQDVSRVTELNLLDHSPVPPFFNYNFFLLDVTVYNCSTGTQVSYQNSVTNDVLTLTETNGIVELKECLIDTLNFSSATGIVKVHIRGFALKSVNQES